MGKDERKECGMIWMNEQGSDEWRGICFHKWIPGFQPFDIENHRMLCVGWIVGGGRVGVGGRHGRMNYKDTKPYKSAFLSVDLFTEFAAFCLTDFIDWRYIHSWFVFSTKLVNCCPHGRRNYTCVLLPLYRTFSRTSSPLPPSQCTVNVYADSVWLWGGGGVKCTVDHILQEFYTLFLTRFRTHKIAPPPQTKMTSKDDIKGLVSLKFLRPRGGGFDLADGRIGSRESILRPLSHQTGLCPITQHPPLSGPSQYILYQIYCPAFILGKLKNYIFPQSSGWLNNC